MTDHTDIKDMKAWLAGERSGISLAMNTARGGLRVLETIGVVAQLDAWRSPASTGFAAYYL